MGDVEEGRWIDNPDNPNIDGVDKVEVRVDARPRVLGQAARWVGSASM